MHVITILDHDKKKKLRMNALLPVKDNLFICFKSANSQQLRQRVQRQGGAEGAWQESVFAVLASASS